MSRNLTAKQKELLSMLVQDRLNDATASQGIPLQDTLGYIDMDTSDLITVLAAHLISLTTKSEANLVDTEAKIASRRADLARLNEPDT